MQSTKNKGERIFHLPAKGFTDTERSFLIVSMNEDNEETLFSNIEHIVNKYGDNKTRLLHELAEHFRIDAVEGFLPEVEKLDYQPYKEILLNQIYSVDHFKIAEELLRQYEEKAGKVKAEAADAV